MGWVSALGRLATWRAQQQFLRDIRDPEAARARAWRRVHGEVIDAPFWREHRPRKGADRLEGFPLTTYEHYRDAIAASVDDGHGRLSLLPVQFFAESGGTTARQPKRFPLTASYERQVRQVIGPYMRQLLGRHTGVTAAPPIVLAAPQPVGDGPGGVPVGYVSWYVHDRGGGRHDRLSGVPRAAYRDAESLLRWAPLYAVSQDLSLISGVNAAKISAFVERIYEGMPRWWLLLEGKAPMPEGLPPLRISRARLALLRRVFERPRPTLDEIWPTLAFLTCWKGGVSALQLPALAPMLGTVAVYDSPYVCTEAWLTVPQWGDRLGGPLRMGDNIVELLPVGAEPVAGNLIAAWQALPDERYEVVITTTMGLLRYRLFDVVRCTGFVERSPVLVFEHKAAFILRLGQTSLAESDVARLLAELGQPEPTTWCLGPNRTGDGLVVWVRGPGGARGEEDVVREETEVAQWLPRFELALTELHPVYAADRRAGWMRVPAVDRLPGDHAVWQRPSHAQAKPRLLITTVTDGSWSSGL